MNFSAFCPFLSIRVPENRNFDLSDYFVSVKCYEMVKTIMKQQTLVDID